MVVVLVVVVVVAVVVVVVVEEEVVLLLIILSNLSCKASESWQSASPCCRRTRRISDMSFVTMEVKMDPVLSSAIAVLHRSGMSEGIASRNFCNY